jgi:hypothetical protein
VGSGLEKVLLTTLIRSNSSRIVFHDTVALMHVSFGILKYRHFVPILSAGFTGCRGSCERALPLCRGVRVALVVHWVHLSKVGTDQSFDMISYTRTQPFLIYSGWLIFVVVVLTRTLLK